MRIRTLFFHGHFFILLAHKKKFYFLFLHLQAFFISQNFNFLIQALKPGIFFAKKKLLRAKRLYMGNLIETFIYGKLG